MTKWITLTAALMLAACGADGEPQAPAAKPGVSVSGEALAGVGGSL